MNNQKVLIAMSGGVDSSVAALLLSEQGFDCIGATMRLYDSVDAGISREKTCCSLEDVEDARSVALRLGMPYYVFNFTDDFRTQVIDRFVAAYEDAATPNPCIDCNRYMKFDKFFGRARLLGCDSIATGHYARVSLESGRYLIKKAADAAKDQSYVLYFLTQEQLRDIRFPLGVYTKPQIREIAAAHGLVNARKRESQDICFVPDGDYARVIESYCGKSCPGGNFVDKAGNILGRHEGIIRYTIGQRKGIGISGTEALYVCDKCARDNTVTLGGAGELFSSALSAADFNWVACDPPTANIRAAAKVRYRQTELPVTVIPTGPDTVQIVFDAPQRAVARGQAVVLYDGDILLGGGTIC
ncbi:MAG TPA: tRNA 2-thiouridine(34) synthase MnmA [Terriglobales bacterium]|nr:tRNA 2-thiouridine(34) synthase MnmA [Terriglobales bacterium]